jgi:hypothetical protein
MQGAWRVYLISALLSCAFGAGTAFVTVRLLVPAPGQSLSSTLPVSPAAQSSPILEDVVEMPWGREVEVFYKAPFAAPPHLTFPDGLENTRCEVTDQKAGSFKLRRSPVGPFGEPNIAKVKWKAEGQPAK